MRMRSGFVAWSGFVVFALAAAIPSAAQAPGLAMLGKLDKGSWELRGRGQAERQRICLRTGRELIQLRHRGEACRHLVVQDDMNEIAVHYTCRGKGYGRTSIRMETSELVQIHSQGVASGAPFVLEGEARRVGDC